MGAEFGQILSHYRLVEKIGEGGMGVVWKAEDTVLNRTVAVKLLPADLALDEERRRLFLEEARLAASVSHGNIVHVHELGREGDLDFIVMEFVEGQPLSCVLPGRPLPPDKVAEIGLQIAEGLARAHRKGLVHRDIKPANILITPDGEVKIVDFGLAALFSPLDTTRASKTRTLTSTREEETHQEIVGTLPYMSPEQVRGEKLDARTDIFSFGTVLYEMTTGQRPFQGSTPAEITNRIDRSHPTPVHVLVPDVPIALDLAIDKSMARSPRDRYQVMDDIAVDLRRLLRDLETNSSPSYSELPQGSLRKRPRRMALIAVVTTVAVVAAVIFSLGRWRKPHQDRMGTFESMQMSRLTSSGNVESAVISSDGRFLGQVRRDEGLWSLWVQQVATGSEVPVVAGRESGIAKIRFSQDGNYLYYLEPDPVKDGYSALFQVPALGGKPRKILFDIDSAPTFSPDGTQFAFIRGVPPMGERALMVANADGSAERVLALGKDSNSFMGADPSWSPDGQQIALVRGKRLSAELIAVAVTDGKITRIGENPWTFVSATTWLPDGGGLVLTGAMGTGSQIWTLTYPGGSVRRITNDLNQYRGVSITEDATKIATVQQQVRANLYVAPTSDLVSVRQITSDDHAIQFAVTVDGTILVPTGRGFFSIASDGRGRRQLTSGRDFGSEPRTARASRVVIFTSTKDDVAHVYSMNLDGSNIVQVTNGSGEISNSVDPEGRWALYTCVDSSRGLWRVPLSGGASQLVVPESYYSLGFSPDGEKIAYLWEKQEGEIFRPMVTVIPVDGGEPVATIPAPRFRGVARWSPDSKGIDYVDVAAGKWNIWRQPLTGGNPRQLSDFTSLQIFDFEWSPDGNFLVLSRGELRRDAVIVSGFR